MPLCKGTLLTGRIQAQYGFDFSQAQASKLGSNDEIKLKNSQTISGQTSGKVIVKDSSGNVMANMVRSGVQVPAYAVVATATGATTGTIPDGVSFCTVTVTTDANDIVVLPTPTPGNVVWLLSDAVAFELRSSDPATISINGGAGSNYESAIAAADLLTRCVCLSATKWIVTNFAADGTESAADAAA